MDTMETTKIVGGICGAWLILLLIQFGAETVLHGGGHSKDHENAYVIEVEDSGDTEVVEEAPVEIAEFMTAAVVDDGASLFKRGCSSCHKVEDGGRGTGPYLYGVVDRPIGSVDFAYSDGFAETGEAWDAQSLSEFLTNPKKWAPKTKMAYKGLKKPEDRANIIAYLDSLDN